MGFIFFYIRSTTFCLIFCGVFIGHHVSAYAQATTTDALFNLSATEPKIALKQAQNLEKTTRQAEIRADAISIQGTAWRNLGQLDSALRQHKRAYELRKQLFGERSDAAIRSLNNRALCEKNVDSAIYYFKKVIDFRQQKKDITPSDRYELGDLYRCLADSYCQKNDFLTARAFAKQAVAELDNENGPQHAAALNRLGQCLLYTQDREGAKRAFEKAILLTQNQANQPNLSVFYANLGDCYAADSLAFAVRCYEKAHVFLKADKDNNRAKIALKLANCYQQQHDITAAERVYSQVLTITQDPSVFLTSKIRLAVLKAEKGDKTTALQSLEAVLNKLADKELREKIFPFETLEALSERAKMVFDKADFAAAQTAFTEAITFAEVCEKGQQSPQSALILRGYFQGLYGGAAESAARRGDVATAFDFSEKGKAFLQKNNVISANVNDYAVQVRANLRLDEVLLAYCFGRQDLLLFVLTKDKIDVKFIKTDALKATVIRFYEHINHPPDRVIGHYFHREGAFLYEKLVAPAAIVAGKRLTIVPDGILNYVPFEAFLTQTVADNRCHVFNELPYLLHRHAVRYQAAALLPQNPRTGQAKRSFLAVAPQFDGHPSGVLSLQHSEREAQQVVTVFGGKILSGSSATESAFKEAAAQYRILHLSTHGILNDIYPENSFLTFATPDSLTVADIEQLHLSADLVVLSACQSASGVFYGGEGLMSMGRAFIRTGSRSVIGSLWNVNDSLTTDLMTHLYENLADGQDKDRALQAAKLRFAEGNNLMAGHPYFWAAFTLSGEVEKLENDKMGKKMGFLLGFGVCLSLFWFYRRRKCKMFGKL
jgi:CHAT domain-containing protein